MTMTLVERMPHRWGRVKPTLSVPLYQPDSSFALSDLLISISNGFGQFSFTLTSACSSGGGTVVLPWSVPTLVAVCTGTWASPYSQTNAALPQFSAGEAQHKL